MPAKRHPMMASLRRKYNTRAKLDAHLDEVVSLIIAEDNKHAPDRRLLKRLETKRACLAALLCELSIGLLPGVEP